MAKQNTAKRPPKGSVRFSLSLSPEQKSAKQAILHHPYNFIVGKAGSGKTLLACQIALDMFFKRMIDKIIITRPTVSTEDNGFLPGSEKEKMEPWLVPIRSNMRKIYNKPLILDKMEKDESIELLSSSILVTLSIYSIDLIGRSQMVLLCKALSSSRKHIIS